MLDDLDPGETQEWIDASDSVRAVGSSERAVHLLDEGVAEAGRKGVAVPDSAPTPHQTSTSRPR